jgi:putative ABC transport system permease protein
MMSHILFDLRVALRAMRRQPLFTAVVVATLAVGIGANTAMFALVHAALLKPLPYKEPDRLVLARRTVPGRLFMWNSPPDYYDYREQTPGFETLAACGSSARDVTVYGGERPERVPGLDVTYDLFGMLGVAPVAGRLFGPADGQAGAPHAVIVNARLAQQRFGSAEAAVGKTLVMFRRKVPATIVGVMPATFRFLDAADMWIPIRRGEGDGPGMRMAHNWVLVGRLKAGETIDGVQRQLDIVSGRLQQAYPSTNKLKGLRIDPLQSALLSPQTPMLVMLMSAVALVLFIACANVAGMLLTRGVSRRPELAMRAALGASRSRLVAQLLTESLLLGAIAGIAGILIATWLRQLLPIAAGLSEAGVETSGSEALVLACAFGVSLATGIACGVAPALRASSRRLVDGLAPGARASESRKGTRLRSVLVAAQVALSLVLLVGAGLLVRSLVGLMNTDLRFRTEHLMATAFDMPAMEPDERLQLQALLRGDLEAIPGVSEVAFTSHMPVLEPWEDPPVWPADHPPPDPSQRRSALKRTVMPGFFKTLGIRLLSGRDLSETDRMSGPRAMVVNDTFARQFFPGEDAVGERVMMGHPEHPDEYLIVGVVETARTEGVAGQPMPSAYISATQAPLQRVRALFRSALPADQLTRAVRKAVAARTAEIPVDPVVSVDSLISDSLVSERVTTLTLAAFSVLALLLAALGLFGVLSHYVAQRTHEIGVRMALGANAHRVVATVLWRSALMVGPGLVAGLLAALAATKVLTGFLHGVRPTDPFTFACVTAMLALTALAASAWPAWNASRVDPVRALRGE